MAGSVIGIVKAGAAGGAHDRSRRCALCGAAVMLVFTSGCAVVSVVSTAATVAAAAVSTAVDAGVGAVKVTGKVIGKGVDAVTGHGSPAPAAAPGLPQPPVN